MKKTVLVTGAAGFIGHHVVSAILTRTNWDVVALDRLDISGNLNRIQHVIERDQPRDGSKWRKRIKFVWHDLKAEITGLNKTFIGKPDIIIHLAAGSHVDRSIAYPMDFAMDNVIGTVNMLEFARALPELERFIYFSTDEIFGPAPDGVAYKERDRYNSTNPYSASKAAASQFCVAYNNTYGTPVYVTNTMNVFGQRQHPEKFIPMCIRQIRDDSSVTIHSDPTKTIAGSRFYVHAEDVADALLFLLDYERKNPDNNLYAPDFGGAVCPHFNIVGKEEVDNLTLAEMIATAQNKELKYKMVDFHTSRPGHDMRYALDGSYMKSLGWEPRYSLQQRINEVVNWSLENPDWIEATR